jgi:hypothetical protein
VPRQDYCQLSALSGNLNANLVGQGRNNCRQCDRWLLQPAVCKFPYPVFISISPPAVSGNAANSASNSFNSYSCLRPTFHVNSCPNFSYSPFLFPRLFMIFHTYLFLLFLSNPFILSQSTVLQGRRPYETQVCLGGWY